MKEESDDPRMANARAFVRRALLIHGQTGKTEEEIEEIARRVAKSIPPFTMPRAAALSRT